MGAVKVASLARVGFWLCVLIVLYVSLVPGNLRPHTGTSGHVEHFVAYAATAFLFSQGSRLRDGLICALSLTALSGAVEIVQVYVPGRTGEFAGFFYSTLGTWLGLFFGALAWSAWLTRRTGKRV
jgi:VanZ family protein